MDAVNQYHDRCSLAVLDWNHLVLGSIHPAIPCWSVLALNWYRHSMVLCSIDYLDLAEASEPQTLAAQFNYLTKGQSCYSRMCARIGIVVENLGTFSGTRVSPLKKPGCLSMIPCYFVSCVAAQAMRHIFGWRSRR